MTRPNKTLPFPEAAAYVAARLPNGKAWTNPRRALQKHLDQGRIKPIQPRRKGRTVQIAQKQLDNLIAWLANHPLPNGGNRADLSSVEADYGKESDQALADKAGVAVDTVYRRRRKAGIPSTRVNLADVPGLKERLGKESDSALARELNVDRHTIGKYRRGLGIGAYERRHTSEGKTDGEDVHL